MMKLKVSNRAHNVIASPIRKFLPFMQQAEKEGVKVYKVNVGDPDLEVPPAFLKTVKDYAVKTLGYAPSPGITAHMQAWQKYYKQFGVSVELIVFEPLYASYKSFSVMTGIKLVPVTLPLKNNFVLPDISVVEKKISKKTKAIVVINPDNPTGKLWSKKELDGIIGLAKKHNLFIISDETYREIRFDGKKGECLLTRKDARQNIIVCDSVSKRFSMPGARIGCIVSFNPEVMSSVLKFAQARLSAGTLEQLGTIPLLSNSAPYVNRAVAEYKKRQKVVATGLSKIKGAIFKPSMGAFYQAVQLPVESSEDFVKFMISKFRHNKQTVMVTPMQDFYITPGLGKSEIRIAYVLNTKDLATAMDLLRRGVEEYQKTK
jgi:aspartate aminotransferase